MFHHIVPLCLNRYRRRRQLFALRYFRQNHRIFYVFSILRTCSWYELTVETSKEAIYRCVSFRTWLRRKFVLLSRTYLLSPLHASSIGFKMQCFIGKL